MLTASQLKDIFSEARPIIERQLDDAEVIAGFRKMVADNGGDWSALKALIKAQIQDERDDNEGKRVSKILERADFSAAYADMLGLANMNKENFISDHDPDTGEVVELTFSNPRAKASEDNGATAPDTDKEPVNSVAGDASRPTSGGGSTASCDGETPSPGNVNVRRDSRERPATDFKTTANTDTPPLPAFLDRTKQARAV